MKRITLEDALNILTNDTTYRRSVFFAVNNINKYYINAIEYINGVKTPMVRTDRGQIYSRATIYELGAAAMFGGIFVEE